MVSPRELVRGISQKYPFQVARSNDSGSFGAPRTLIHNCWPLIITSSAVPSFASLRSSLPTRATPGPRGSHKQPATTAFMFSRETLEWNFTPSARSARSRARQAARLNDRCYDFPDAALQLCVVGNGTGYCDVACQVRVDSASDQLSRVNQEPCRYAFFQAMALQVADLFADQHQVAGGLVVDVAFVDQDL